MNQFEAQYWSLYADFIETFNELQYKGIPLPLLCHFNSLLKPKLRELISSTDMEQVIKYKINRESEIQPYFDRYVEKMKNHRHFKSKKSHGKILIYSDVKLRFPPMIYKSYFNASQTIILSKQSQRDEYFGIPVHTIADNEFDSSTMAQNYIKMAERIFTRHDQHPIFSQTVFQNKFIHLIPEMVNLLVALDQYYDQHAISCVIVGYTGTPISRVITLLAAQRGIPSICMQHGSILCKVGGYTPVLATKQAVYGPYEMNWYKKRGVPDYRLAMIGHPRFDIIYTKKTKPRKQFMKKLKLNPKYKNVLIVTQPNRDIQLWQQFIRQAAKKMLSILS